MDSVDAIDPQNEVRKLQELVKKLERQNEVLRNKQPGTPGNNVSNFDSKDLNGQSDIHGNDIVKTKLHANLNSLADLEDVNYSLPFEEYKWLYESTKRLSPEQSREDIISWIRQDLDHPSPEIKSSRRALIHSLDEAARMRHSSSSPVLGSQLASVSKSTGALSRSTEDGNGNVTSSRLGLLRKNGMAPPGSSRLFDAGTFTRPKKVDASPSHGEGDQCHDIPNAEDIENLAKQQEESLRQSVTPAKGTMRKHSYMDGDNGARLSPSRFDVDGNYLGQHRGSLSSDHSTPPDSPHGNHGNLHFHTNSSNADLRGRRNIPSASGLQYRSHNSSDSSLERHSVDTNGSDEVNLAPEAMRGPSARIQAPSYRRNIQASTPLVKRSIPGLAPGLAQPQRAMAPPQRQTGLPTARRQIVRPTAGVRSSLPTFRKPNAPPKSTSSERRDENWQEGCF